MATRKRKRAKIQEAEVPLSSMIDVVFLLLIYFIVTQKPIIEDTLLAVNLPSPSSSTQRDTPPTLFTIDVFKLSEDPAKSNDYYHINQRGPWHIDQVREHLQNAAENDPEQTIIVNCGPNAQHSKLIQLLDAINSADLKNVNIMNDESIRFTPGKR